MDFDDTPEEAAFRAEARAWLEANAIPKGHPDDFSAGIWSTAYTEDTYIKRCREWQGRLAEGGWAGITWPKDVGGRGAKPIESVIFNQEQARHGVSNGVFAIAIGMVGPTLLAHGNEEQKRRYLPAMLRGDEVWCQLFSEPEAGSDLANVTTRAVLDGDEWVVTGQKVWTSSAQRAEWGILLARTHPERPKHRGITYFAARHGVAGHRHPSAAADDRRRPLQRGVPRRGPDPRRQRRRRAGGGLARRADHPGQRAHGHRGRLGRRRPARADRAGPAARASRRPARAPGRRRRPPAQRAAALSCACGRRPRCPRAPGPVPRRR